MRTSGDAIAYWMSCWRPVTRFTFTPGPRSSAYCVTDGPTVMPISLASTPCSANVASSTRPPSSAIRWSAFLVLPRLRMVPGGRFHGPWCATASSPTAIASWPPAASMKTGTAASATGSSAGAGTGSTYGSGSGSSSNAMRSMARSGASSSNTVGRGEPSSISTSSPMPRPPRPSPTAVRAFAAAFPVARAVALMTTPMDRPSARSRPTTASPPRTTVGADLTRRRRERPAHRRADEPAGAAEVVDAAVDRRAPVRDVQDADVGDEQEERADGDADGRDLGVGVGGSVGVSASSASLSAASRDAHRRGQSRRTAKPKHATGTATRPRPKIAPVPSARPVPTGPARSEVRPRTHSTPRTISATAPTSPQWPSSWRPAAARLRATTPGSVETGFAAGLRFGAGDRSGFRFPAREGARRRVVVAGIPAPLTLPTPATAAFAGPARRHDAGHGADTGAMTMLLNPDHVTIAVSDEQAAVSSSRRCSGNRTGRSRWRSSTAARAAAR